jgi:DNA polymerase-1
MPGFCIVGEDRCPALKKTPGIHQFDRSRPPLHETAMTDTVYLIDTFSLIFQVFHAIPPMTSPSGQPTNAIFGISRDLVLLLKEHRPDWLICAWDSSAPGFRSELYPEYKANRSETPVDLVPQIGPIRTVIEAFGIPVIEHAGWEADDVIATLAGQAAARGFQVRIVSSDKDIRQLLGPQVQLYNLRKNLVLDEAFLLADWGIRPDQVIDFQSLVGDAVDNIPGVPLVGPKKAAQLLNQFGTLEDVLAHADEAPGAKLRENLKHFAEQARMSRELVRLKTDLPLEFDWTAARHPQPLVTELQSLFRGFGFRKLIDDVREWSPATPPAPVAKKSQTKSLFGDDEAGESKPGFSESRASPSQQQTSDVSEDFGSLDAEVSRSLPSDRDTDADRTWHLVDTPELLATFLDELRLQRRICLDLETTHVDPRRAAIVGWAFCWQPGRAHYLPVQGPADSRLLDAAMVIDALRPILQNPTLELVNQNVKYDLIVLRSSGLFPPLPASSPSFAPPARGGLGGGSGQHAPFPPIDSTLGNTLPLSLTLSPADGGEGTGGLPTLGLDPMVGDYLLDAGARSHNLETLIDKYLHRPSISISELIGTGKKQKSMAEVPVEKVAEYATEDADCSLQIADLMTAELKCEGLWELYWDLERPLIPVLAELEYNGIRVDADELRRQSVEAGGLLETLVTEIHQLAGREFNIDSPLQLRKILFDELHLPVIKKTKTGPSTDQDVLEELAPLHPLPAKIIEHRQLSKLRGTYLDALPELIHPETGRIHCSFNQVVAATGRLSSSDPNLQNIPIRTQAGRQVRKAFTAGEPGWKLVCADYSQIELRMLAHFSRDEVLLDAFAQGVDIHTAVAANVYGIDLTAVDADQRRVAKAVNFGVIYGQSAFGLAAALSIPQDDAAKFIDDYFGRYAGVTQFLEDILTECERTGYARTILGRRRRIEGIRAERNRQRNMAERTAINTVIQGSAADLIKRAMIRVFDRLQREGHPARMLLQIHDELVFEAPVWAVDPLVELVRNEMEHALPLDVPLVVDVSQGDNWLELEDISSPLVAVIGGED